jgi:hypothetical protein
LSNLNRVASKPFDKNKLEINMQGKILAYKKSGYSKHTKEKSTHKTLCTKVW